MIGYPRWRAQRNRRRLRPAPRALAVFLWVLLPIVVLFVPIAILAPTPGVPIALGTFLADAILSLLLLRRWRSTATSVSA
jgi:membrane protein implicated in regulation of membrane protease activity